MPDRGSGSLVCRALLGRLWLAAVLAAAAPAVVAKHEADHRYTVRGYVLDDQERALAGTPIRLRMGARTRASTRTDDSGYYSILLHLHDSDIGRTIELRAGEGGGRIRVHATARDRTTPRVHEANFIAGELVEGKLAWWRIPGRGYTVAGLAGSAIVLVAGWRWVVPAVRRRRRADPSVRRTAKTRRRRSRRR